MSETSAELPAIRTGWRRPASALRWLTLLGMSVASGMLVLGVVVLIEAREDTWNQAKQASDNLVLALERDISRNIAVYDLSLLGAVKMLQEPGIDQVSPGIRQAAIFDQAANADYLGSIVVLDKAGNIIADSTSVVPHKLNLADRDYFQIHQERPDVGLYVSRPFRSRMRNQEASIAISRRMSGSDGRFAGVVVGALRLAYFQSLFGELGLGRHGAVSLIRTDGRLIAREPFRAADLDRDLSDSELFRLSAAASSGQVVGNGALQQGRRLYTFHRVGNLPLIVSVSVAMDEIYAAWWHKALIIGPILALLCSATIALCLLFRREMLRRMVAEGALVEAATKLSVMADTDSLTGMANRRSFDAILHREWKRAIRGHTSLALLMLDADYFKLYNDQYGHQKGDQVLQAIARCIRLNLWRPGDFGARYGGEEFLALLHDTDVAGALMIAERIRSAVADLTIPHAASPLQRVTVSIGLAVAYPLVGQEEALLVKEADMGLYASKHGGRNCVSIAGVSHPLAATQSFNIAAHQTASLLK